MSSTVPFSDFQDSSTPWGRHCHLFYRRKLWSQKPVNEIARIVTQVFWPWSLPGLSWSQRSPYFGEATQLVSAETLRYTGQPLLYCVVSRTDPLICLLSLFTKSPFIYCLQQEKRTSSTPFNFLQYLFTTYLYERLRRVCWEVFFSIIVNWYTEPCIMHMDPKPIKTFIYWCFFCH